MLMQSVYFEELPDSVLVVVERCPGQISSLYEATEVKGKLVAVEEPDEQLGYHAKTFLKFIPYGEEKPRDVMMGGILEWKNLVRFLQAKMSPRVRFNMSTPEAILLARIDRATEEDTSRSQAA